MADQQAALRWVRRNIAAFGGDAGNVTLWGQSAGGRSVCAQLASPAARPLFDKAIVQSSPCANDLLTRREADARGQAAAAKLGCPDAACLRDKTAAELVLSHEPRTVLRARFADYLQWLPVTGTPAVPHQPLDAIRHGATASKQVIFGGTRNEMNVFVGIHYDGRGNPITAEQYPEVLRELYGTRRARAIQDRYPHQQHPSPSLALATAMSDDGSGVGTCRQQPTADAAARHSATYTYEFAQPSGEVIGGLPLGATHSDDLPYFFDGDYPGAAADQPPAGDLKVLADKLIGYWTTFARTGKPGPDWPGYQRGTALSLAVDHIGMTDVARAHQCEFWLRLAQPRQVRPPRPGHPAGSLRTTPPWTPFRLPSGQPTISRTVHPGPSPDAPTRHASPNKSPDRWVPLAVPNRGQITMPRPPVGRHSSTRT